MAVEEKENAQHSSSNNNNSIPRQNSKSADGGRQSGPPDRKNCVLCRNGPPGKSCRGYLLYTSKDRSLHRKPLCVGIERSFDRVPCTSQGVGKSEWQAKTTVKSLNHFEYHCLGYSVYLDNINNQRNVQEARKELPVCVGHERLKYSLANAAAAHDNNKGVESPIQTRISDHSSGEDYHPEGFLRSYVRAAVVVASGVAKNVRKVGNDIKKSINGIISPYRKGSK